ncbi:hypothetical protein AcV5_006023 [Taiwanofungus camphoratus]|nr:hypothetical protein AcW2_004459 [Antrodia cinnamomea]KAI0933084.1 hypothetical protein AcV7_004661 [Antrodia cinnamomea]KAI0934047.1 hypothetical protein AcV5_006023 [Antrodia cinnamomea]
MAAIVSPQPRVASPVRSQSSSPPLLSPPIYLPDDLRVSSHRRVLLSPPRLMSPIDLVDRGVHKAYSSKSSSPCSPTKRRRGVAYSTSRSPRRRHCARADCCINSLGGPALFDRLPWISNMEATPDRVSVWDTADLSLLSEEHSEAPCSGPVRRRKTPLRPNPLSPVHEPAVYEHSIAPDPHELTPSAVFPFNHPAADPRTPSPRERLIPSEVRFRGLLPVFPPDRA